MRVHITQGTATDARIRKWIAAVGRTQWSPVMRLASAFWSAARRAGDVVPAEHAVHSVYRRGLRIAFRDPVEMSDLAVDGDDLRKAGIPPGPVLGRMLAVLLERVVEDPSLNEVETLLAIAREQAR
jgi:tRNA nucleotidyltransferase (CCA-adding enzyme)